jgi:hypothetical protein
MALHDSRRLTGSQLESADNRAIRDHLNLLQDKHGHNGPITSHFTLMQAMRLRFLRRRYLDGGVRD